MASDDIPLSVLYNPRRASANGESSLSLPVINVDHHPDYDDYDEADDYPRYSRPASYQYSQADDYPDRSRPVSYVPSLRHFPSADETLRHQPSNISDVLHIARNHHLSISEEALANPNRTAVELDHFPAVPMNRLKKTFSKHDHQPQKDDDAMSQLTLTGVPEGPFDFARFLRKVMRQ